MNVKLTAPQFLWFILVVVQLVLGCMYFVVGLDILIALIPTLFVGGIVMIASYWLFMKLLLGSK